MTFTVIYEQFTNDLQEKPSQPLSLSMLLNILLMQIDMLDFISNECIHKQFAWGWGPHEIQCNHCVMTLWHGSSWIIDVEKTFYINHLWTIQIHVMLLEIRFDLIIYHRYIAHPNVFESIEWYYLDTSPKTQNFWGLNFMKIIIIDNQIWCINNRSQC